MNNEIKNLNIHVDTACNTLDYTLNIFFRNLTDPKSVPIQVIEKTTFSFALISISVTLIITDLQNVFTLKY